MFFKRSLIALVLCAGVAGCVANPNPDVVPGTDIPIVASGPTWDMAAGPSPVAGTTWWGEPISNVLSVDADTAMTWWGQPISNLVAVAAVGQ